MRAMCDIGGCGVSIVARGLCDKHYRRLLRNGDASTTKTEAHGKHDTKEYHLWANMIYRCINPKSDHYKDYGGRGIKVCERWRKSFLAFYEDMGERPTPKHSIDRKNNDGHYSCGKCLECVANNWTANCKWSTKFEQERNKRPRTEHQGVKLKKLTGKYEAYIRRNDIRRYLGSFNTFQEAIRARKRAEQEYI